MGCKNLIVQVMLCAYYDAAFWATYNNDTMSKLATCYDHRLLKLSLDLDDVRVLLRFYLTLDCHVLALFYITVRLFSAYVDEQYKQCCSIRSAG